MARIGRGGKRLPYKKESIGLTERRIRRANEILEERKRREIAPPIIDDYPIATYSKKEKYSVRSYVSKFEIAKRYAVENNIEHTNHDIRFVLLLMRVQAEAKDEERERKKVYKVWRIYIIKCHI